MRRIYTFLEGKGRILLPLFWVFLGVSSGLALFHLFSLIYLQGIEDLVAPIHWMMGRAILNGLTLYEDILETKPPGMFLLSAASYALFGTTLLGNILHTTLLLSLPILFVLFAYKQVKHQEKNHRLLTLALALLGSITLLRYILPHPGPWSPDFFGAASSFLYLLAIADPEKLVPSRVMLSGAPSEVEGRRRSTQQVFRIALATLALFAAIGIKEPFFLSTLAGALILLRSRRQFLYGWVIPFSIAAITGILVLALFGWLDGYFTIYLPSMFGGYIQRHSLPFWQRGLAVDLVALNLASLSFVLPIFIFALLALFLLHEELTRERKFAIALTTLLLLGAAFLLALTGPRLMFYTSQWVLGILSASFALLLFQNWKERNARFPLILFLIATVSLFITSYQWCQYGSPIFAVTVKLLTIFPHGANLPCLGSFSVQGVLILLSLLLPLRTFTREARHLSRAVSLLLGIIFLTYLGILIYFFLETPLHPFTPVPPLFVLGFYGAYVIRTFNAVQRKLFLRALLLFVAIFLSITAVSLGTDFQNQHYLSASPFYAALLLSAISFFGKESPGKRTRGYLFALCALVALTMFSTYPYAMLSLRDHKKHLTEMNAALGLAKESAQYLDAILDACEVDRYYELKNVSTYNPYHGFTEHSPLNFFYWAGVETIDMYSEVITEREMENFFASEIIVAPLEPHTPVSPWEKDIQGYLQTNFTEEPWPCADTLPTIPDRTLLFRKIP